MNEQSLQQYIGCTLSYVQQQLQKQNISYTVEYATSDKSKHRDTLLVVQVKQQGPSSVRLVVSEFRLQI